MRAMANEERSDIESSGPILHVIVIGFHHKKGCQVHFIPLVVNNGFCKFERRLDCTSVVCEGGYVLVHKLKHEP